MYPFVDTPMLVFLRLTGILGSAALFVVSLVAFLNG
jgi:hypothetical protein